MQPTILVTGGTGRLGHHVVARLQMGGHDVRVLSRRDHPSTDGVQLVTCDLLKGAGIEPALEGVGTFIHLAGARIGDERTTRNLVLAATRTSAGAPAPHLIFISVVGADRIPVVSRIDRMMFGYFASKLAAEQVVARAGLPWTILRATQFHGAMLATVEQMAKLPVIPVPSGFRFQPIDEGEVADRLVELALGTPAGLVPEMGGPRAYPMADLVRGYLRARGKHRLIVPMWTTGRAARALKAGGNLAPDQAVGRRTWEDVLAADVIRSTGRTGIPRQPATR